MRACAAAGAVCGLGRFGRAPARHGVGFRHAAAGHVRPGGVCGTSQERRVVGALRRTCFVHMDECQQPHLGGFFLIPGDPEAVCKKELLAKSYLFLEMKCFHIPGAFSP